MGTNNIEKLLTDLKNLPKQNAPEDFEQKLLERINLYERRKSSGESIFRRFILNYYNPIYVPAFVIVLLAVLIVYSVNQNQVKFNSIEASIEKAIPIVQENQSVSKNEPQKITVPKKRDFVVKRDRVKLNLGPGLSLDERDYANESGKSNQPSLVTFPIINEPITIRIPPPEEIFNNEIEKLNNFNNNRDSLNKFNLRRR
jgi:hypothetical protein